MTIDLIMLPLSIAIIAKNEEQHLSRLLPLLRDMAEQIVVVIDSSTTDLTHEVCKQYSADVSVEDFHDTVSQKQSALSKCRCQWYLSLDCDEFPDDVLLRDIKRVITEGRPAAFRLRRRTVYMGRELRYAWQPDEHVRLIHRSLSPRVVNVNGHDQLQCDSRTSTTLEGWMLHYSYTGIIHHFEKTLLYARIGARDYSRKGRRFSILNLLINPWIAFIKLYIIRRGFLDGVPGLVAGVSTWLHVFLKYALLWKEHTVDESQH